ncbi:hypothetical protein D1872_292530 [compost metagenome]
MHIPQFVQQSAHQSFQTIQTTKLCTSYDEGFNTTESRREFNALFHVQIKQRILWQFHASSNLF